MNQFSHAKIRKGNYYLYKGVVSKIVNINEKENRVVLYKHDTFSNEIIELDTAHLSLTPVFLIGEVARMLNRKVDTLRKYERIGIIGPAKRYRTGDNSQRRYYTKEDVFKIADCFAQQRSVGRPARSPRSNSKINRYDLAAGIKAKFKD